MPRGRLVRKATASPASSAVPMRPRGDRSRRACWGVVPVDGLSQRGADHAGADGLDADAVGRPLLGHSAAQHDEGRLGQ